MADMDDLDFLLDDDEPVETAARGYWNIVIVDDDEDVHQATKYALSKFSFMNREIKWYDAYSAEEAKRLVPTIPDVAMMLLDVVMETDDAGLKFMEWFREGQVSPCTRVILRTGQPGQAPERQIIVDYDLHDYKTKTELSSEKLFTTTVAALRAFHDMRRLELTRLGLEGIIAASGNLFQIQTMVDYANSVLTQIDSVLNIRASGIICARHQEDGAWNVIGRTGEFDHEMDDIFDIIARDDEGKGDGYLLKTLADENGVKYVVYLEPVEKLDDLQQQILLMFCNNISTGINNIKLYDGMISAHKATVTSLAQVTEYRDQHTGQHIFRISKGVEALARELLDRGVYPDEMSEGLVAAIGIASTLHDVGKISTPDAILLKPGSLTPEEFDEMKKHPTVGAQILQSTIDLTDHRVDYLEMGHRIALYHHERWDGKGYPQGLAGRDIPIEARITSIIDVFDALTNKRCYKTAFSFEESMEIIISGKGLNFDPQIVDVFVDVAEGIKDL